MRKCPVCGFNNMDTREACLKCQASLTHRMQFEPTEKDVRAFGKPRVDVISALGRAMTRLGRRVMAAVETPLPEDAPHRFPFLAATLSLVPGLGQIYNHQPRKALYLVAAFAVSLALSIHFITHTYLGNIFPACAILCIMVSFADALLTAGRINGQRFILRHVLAAFLYPIFLLGFFGTLVALWTFFGRHELSLFYVSHDYMRPALFKGDRICGEGITYWFRKPRPGDVVRYDPPNYQVEIPGELEGTIYLVNAQNGWERVMATAGETLECRNFVYYVNGRKLSKAYYPLVNGQLWPNFKVTCPPDRYIVLITTTVENQDLINNLRAQAGTSGYNTQTPAFRSNAIFSRMVNGEKEPFETAFIVKRSDIFDRAWFRYRPAVRRCFFEARGPRFDDRP